MVESEMSAELWELYRDVYDPLLSGSTLIPLRRLRCLFERHESLGKPPGASQRPEKPLPPPQPTPEPEIAPEVSKAPEKIIWAEAIQGVVYAHAYSGSWWRLVKGSWVEESTKPKRKPYASPSV
jgi:hypothetical protein